MSNPVKRSFSFLVVFMVGVFSLVACSPAPPAKQFRLRVGVYKSHEYLPYWTMSVEGIGNHYGLEFEEVPVQGSAALVEGLARGEIDVGYVSTAPAFAAAERGLIPEKIVFVASNSFADPDNPGIAVLAAPSITSWKDLEGHYIAIVAKNSVGAVGIEWRLLHEGVSDCKFVEMPIANAGLAVSGGYVAAAAMLEPFLTQSLVRGDGKLLGWVVGGPPFDRIEMTMTAFRADLNKNDPEAVKAFLRAHLQAVKWMGQNPQGARSILARCLEVSKEVSQRMTLMRWRSDARNDAVLLEEMQPVLVNTGLLKAPVPVNGLYDETLLEQVLAENR